MPNDDRLARKIFTAQIEGSIAEDRLFDALDAAGLADLDWGDFWTDSYDESFELGPVADDFVLPEKCLSVLWDAGFNRGWVNYADQTQIYYHHTAPLGSERHKSGSPHNRNRSGQVERKLREALAKAEAERDALRKCVQAADTMASMRTQWARDDYDEARAALKQQTGEQ